MVSSRSNHHRLLSYTKLLASHVNQGRHHKALALFHYMHNSPTLSLDLFVYPLALKSITFLNLPHNGTAMHAHCTKIGLLTNPYIASSLIVMRGKCISISSARQLFDEIRQRNEVVWNTMISLYTHNHDIQSALELFESMDVSRIASSYNSIVAALSETDGGASRAVEFCRRMQVEGVKPNLVTVLALLPGCVSMAALSLVKEIHGFSVRNHIDPNTQLRSGLVETYGRCGCLSNARKVFDTMSERDVVAWSAMLSAYALNGEAEAALSVFRQMELAKIRPDGISFLGVLKACSHAGLPDEALGYFKRMREDYGVEAASHHYSCLVDVMSRAGRLWDAYEVMKGMPMDASAKAWGALLGACRNHGEVELAELAGRTLFEIEPDNAGNFVLLSSIYASMGKFEDAERVRREMKERGVKRMPGSSWVMSQVS